MFGALFKAFTGRAGFLASLLALSLIAVTAAAVLLSLPRIEQQLLVSSESVLSENLGDGDVVESIQPMGRTILVQGEFQDEAQLAASLQAVEGVREVVINGPDPVDQQEDQAARLAVQTADTREAALSASAGDPQAVDDRIAEEQGGLEAPVAEDAVQKSPEISMVDTQGAAEVTPEEVPVEVVEAVVELVVDSDMPVILEEATESIAGAGQQEQAAVDVPDEEVVEMEYDQSMLSLRYDGRRLQLTGHLAGKQMADLISEEIRNVIPRGSELEVNVDGDGKGSALHWMNEFLAMVAGIPDDAQGVIEGSDREGVQVLPDAEQTLRRVSQSKSDAGLTSGQGISLLAEAGSEQSVGPVSTTESDTLAEEGATAQAHVDESDGAVEAELVAGGLNEAEQKIHPGQYIVELNRRLSEQELFESGEYSIGELLAGELDALVMVLQQNPEMLLRVVGNLDFTVEPRFSEFVGIDRAREIRDYLHDKGIEPFRVFATPLPREYAYEKHVQVVFYISE